MTGIHQGTLSKIEGGADVLWSNIEKIADALGITIQELVCFDTNKVTFNLSGNKAKGVVIHHQVNEQLMQVNQLLSEENAFLKRMLEKAINNNNQNKRKTK